MEFCQYSVKILVDCEEAVHRCALPLLIGWLRQHAMAQTGIAHSDILKGRRGDGIDLQESDGITSI